MSGRNNRRSPLFNGDLCDYRGLGWPGCNTNTCPDLAGAEDIGRRRRRNRRRCRRRNRR